MQPKTYYLRTPSGKLIEIYDMRKFALKRGLDYSGLRKCAVGEYQYYRGYSNVSYTGKIVVRGPNASLKKRFLQRVDKNGSIPPHCPELGKCWIWTGAHNELGYGTISRDGTRNNIVRASRISVELATGKEVPAEVKVCHKCDNPPCVRPSHLFLGTQKDNMQDAKRKGRLPKRDHHGSNHPGWGKKRDAEQRRRIGEGHVREIYILEDKYGAVFEVFDLRRWCDDQGINNANVFKLFSGKAKTAYGYKAIGKRKVTAGDRPNK